MIRISNGCIFRIDRDFLAGNGVKTIQNVGSLVEIRESKKRLFKE